MFTRARRCAPAATPVEPIDAPEGAPTYRQAERPGGGPPADERLTRLGLFWAADGISNPTEPFTAAGSHVAAAAWTRALACHAGVPNVDIFVPLDDLDACRRRFRGVPAGVHGGDGAIARFLPDSALPSQFETYRYDALHDPGPHLPRLSYIRSRFSRGIVPVTCSQHAVSYTFQLHTSFIPILTAQVYPCDAIVCLTHASRHAMERRLTDIADQYSGAWAQPAPTLPRLELIPWGIDTQRFAPRDGATARRDLDLPLDRTVILCLGRLRMQDKMDWTPLLLAFRRVCQAAHPRPLLVLAGANPTGYGQEVLSQAGQLGLLDDIVTLFNLPAALLPSLYNACDIFVSPADSASESFGLTIIEAMACGRPVVASDWNGYKELIVHGQTGFKVRTDWVDCLGQLEELAPCLDWGQHHLHAGQSVSVDVGQLAGYLRCLAESPEQRETMGRQARTRVETLYDWPTVVAQWKQMWAELGAIAGTLKWERQTQMQFLQPSYFRHFAHYASRIIEDSVLVTLTPRGKAVRSGKEPLWLHPSARGFLDPGYMRAAVGALRPASWMGGGLSMGELLQILHKGYGLDRDQALMHLMWLAKYDLIALSGGEPEAI